jgi:hypothetical protein
VQLRIRASGPIRYSTILRPYACEVAAHPLGNASRAADGVVFEHLPYGHQHPNDMPVITASNLAPTKTLGTEECQTTK